MDTEEYLSGCLRTELTTEQYEQALSRMTVETMRLLHGALGLATESGEILDQLKKHLFYNKELDRVNLVEESGDACFYQSIMIDTLKTTWKEVMFKNNKKLEARYGGSFSTEKALNRDLDKERKVLEE